MSNATPYPYPGKFEGGLLVDSIAYDESVSGADEECGDVETCGWYASIIRGEVKPNSEQLANGELILDSADFQFLHDHDAGCIVREDDRGFVYVDWFTDPGKLEHAWGLLVLDAEACENEDEDEDEPADDDYIISDTGQLGALTQVSQSSKVLFTSADTYEVDRFIVRHAEENKFWPNVWYVSDHGNVRPYRLEYQPEEE